MLNSKTLVCSVLAGLAFGGSASRILREQSESPYDPRRFNVYYDLACLYGDTDSNQILSDDEYRNFDIDSLVPSSGLGQDGSFRYLGTVPYPSMSSVFVYLFSSSPLDDCQSGSEGIYDYSSSTYSYSLSFKDSFVVSSDSNSYVNDGPHTSSLALVNFYRTGSGTFYKFSLDGYSAPSNPDGFRFKPVVLDVRLADASIFKSFQFGNGNEFELLYDSDCEKSDCLFDYFDEKTYEIDARQDLWIAPTSSLLSYHNVWLFPYNQKEDIQEARELFYVFFSFKNASFQPYKVKKVWWHSNLLSFTAHDYVHSSGSVFGPFSFGGYSDSGVYKGSSKTPSVNYKFNGKEYNSFLDDKELSSISGSTDDSDQFLDCKFNSLGHQVILRRFNWKNIVRMSDVNGIPVADGDDTDPNRPFKEFMESGDHMSYQYAYCISSDSMVRKIAGVKTVDSSRQCLDIYGTSWSYDYTGRVDSSCHDLTGTVTLAMTVVDNGGTYDIKVANNPLSTRKVYLIGMPAPSLIDFIVADISKFLADNGGWLWPLVVAILLVGLLLLLGFIPSVWRFFAGILKGLLVFVKVVVDLLYLVLVWPVLAVVDKTKGEPLPPLWVWSK